MDTCDVHYPFGILPKKGPFPSIPSPTSLHVSTEDSKRIIGFKITLMPLLSTIIIHPDQVESVNMARDPAK
jgi:hypothetical protein